MIIKNTLVCGQGFVCGLRETAKYREIRKRFNCNLPVLTTFTIKKHSTSDLIQKLN